MTKPCGIRTRSSPDRVTANLLAASANDKRRVRIASLTSWCSSGPASLIGTRKLLFGGYGGIAFVEGYKCDRDAPRSQFKKIASITQ
jgi:hypothetical protein